MAGISRRSFINAAGVGVCALCVGACSAQPARSARGTATTPVGDSTGSSPTPLAAVGDLGTGPVSTVDPVTGKDAFLIKTSGAVSMLSAVCTHAACIVEWSAVEEQFICPCHRSKFNLSGDVLSGPAPKPLPRILVRVEVGQIYRQS